MISNRLKSLLEQNGIPFEVLSHDPAFTAQQLAARMHVPGREFVKTVVVRLDGRYAIAAVPAHRLVDERALARVAGASRCVLASEAEFRELFPECELGAMPPVGPLYGLETYVDEEVTRDDSVVANAGTHAEAIRLSYRDLARVARPTVGRFAVPPPAERKKRKEAPPKRRPAAAPKAGRAAVGRKRAATGRKSGSAKKKKTATPRKAARKAATRAKTTVRKKAGSRRKAATRKKAARKATRRKTALKKSRHR